MLSLATSRPAPISAVICSWLEVAGPRVQTIFARRLIVNPLPVVYTTLAHPRRRVTGVTKRSPHGGLLPACGAEGQVRGWFRGPAESAAAVSRRTWRGAAGGPGCPPSGGTWPARRRRRVPRQAPR